MKIAHLFSIAIVSIAFMLSETALAERSSQPGDIGIVSVTIPKAARTDNLTSQSFTQVAQNASVKQHIQRLQSPAKRAKLLMRKARQQGKSNYKAPGGPSKIVENCVAGPKLIVCDDCDVDWDQFPPVSICIVDSVCYDTKFGNPARC